MAATAHGSLSMETYVTTYAHSSKRNAECSFPRVMSGLTGISALFCCCVNDHAGKYMKSVEKVQSWQPAQTIIFCPSYEESRV